MREHGKQSITIISHLLKYGLTEEDVLKYIKAAKIIIETSSQISLAHAIHPTDATHQIINILRVFKEEKLVDN